MFRSRHEWFAHELQVHRREWVCEYCHHGSFATASSFTNHLKSTHPTVLEGSKLEAILLRSEEPIDKIPATACKLCDQWEIEVRSKIQDSERSSIGEKTEQYSTLAKFRKHLGRHMEQLALFALPMDKGEEDEDLSSEGVEDDLSDHAEEEYFRVENFRPDAHKEDEHVLSDNSRDDDARSDHSEDNIAKTPTKQPDVQTEQSDGKITEPPKTQSHVQSEHSEGKITNQWLEPPTRSGSSRQSQFFINGEGIDREVITTDICAYLGNDALVRPGTHQVCCLV